ncbi:MAG: hypothetical protein JNN12_10700 [Bacteroidetes Order II. Incertae sedis bacterium]|nr:hypothetical protein [Bacteroidetes Order II. bacterium]
MNTNSHTPNRRHWSMIVKTVLLAAFFGFLFVLWTAFQSSGRSIPSYLIGLFGAFIFYFTGSYVLSLVGFLQNRIKNESASGILLDKAALLIALFTIGSTAGAHAMSWYTRISLSERTVFWLWILAVLTIFLMGLSKWVQIFYQKRLSQHISTGESQT